MSFDLAEKRLAWIPIRWGGIQPGEGEGLATNTIHEIECQVELVTFARMREIFTPEEGQPVLSDVEKFKAVVQDWRKVKMGSVSAPMVDENIDKLLQVPMFPAGFEKSYLDAWTGQLEEREKNSESSSSDGRAEKPRGRKAPQG